MGSQATLACFAGGYAGCRGILRRGRETFWFCAGGARRFGRRGARKPPELFYPVVMRYRLTGAAHLSNQSIVSRMSRAV
jgi:hypothetical protein